MMKPFSRSRSGVLRAAGCSVTVMVGCPSRPLGCSGRALRQFVSVIGELFHHLVDVGAVLKKNVCRGGGTYYLYRTLRNLDLDGVLDRLMEASRDGAPGDYTTLEERLERDEFRDRSERFKQEIESEIRRRLVADRGVDAMARTLRKPLPEDVDFMHA